MPLKEQFQLLQIAEGVKYTDKAYIRADGKVFLSPGVKHIMRKPLDPTDPKNAALIAAGQTVKPVAVDGLYIGGNPKREDTSKKMVLTVEFADVIAEKNRIITAYLPLLKKQKKILNSQGKLTPALDVQIESLTESLSEEEPDETAEQRIADLKAIGIEADADGKFISGSVTYGAEILTCSETKFKAALKALKNAK